MKTVTRGGLDDAALLARCLAGDGAAWRTLIDRYGALVWAIVHRMGLSSADAEDAFQATWTVALEELSRLRDPERLAAWLGRIARHRALRIRRGYGIARRAHERVAEDAEEAWVPDDELARLETNERVRAALARIGDRCEELLRVLYFESPRPAYGVIAERLDMRIGSIGPTRARCLGKLRDQIGGNTHE